MKAKLMVAIVCLGSLLAGSTQGAFIVEVDIDGAEEGVLTLNPNFGFGGDTTTASASVASTAYGTTGGNSIFGGNGVSSPDTYTYAYNPGIEADNLAIPADTDLGNGSLASGFIGGAPGLYTVYATWPFTDNVSGGLTTYTIQTSGAPVVVVQIDQNGTGHVWVPLGTIDYTNGPITVTQHCEANTFVSMRSAGVLFEAAVPEPATLSLLALGGLAVLRHRRQ